MINWSNKCDDFSLEPKKDIHFISESNVIRANKITNCTLITKAFNNWYDILDSSFNAEPHQKKKKNWD